MPCELPSDENCEESRIQWGFGGTSQANIFLDITTFLAAVKSCYDAVGSKIRRIQIQKILAAEDWFEQHRDRQTGRRVLSISEAIIHDHELRTSICLTQVNFDVLFAPDGMFKRGQKKFDVYLFKDHLIFEADLKCISSVRPDTIAGRIRSGSEQASRVVVDIRSNIGSRDLIDGLRSGSERNSLLKEIFLFYRGKFYILPTSLIWSKRIYQILR